MDCCSISLEEVQDAQRDSYPSMDTHCHVRTRCTRFRRLSQSIWMEIFFRPVTGRNQRRRRGLRRSLEASYWTSGLTPEPTLHHLFIGFQESPLPDGSMHTNMPSATRVNHSPTRWCSWHTRVTRYSIVNSIVTAVSRKGDGVRSPVDGNRYG